MSVQDDLQRIDEALDLVSPVLARHARGGFRKERKDSGDWVTEADIEANQILRKCLVRDGEAWLSEETVDSADRLTRSKVWIVDPLDGTKEFVQGIPEWCVSIGLVINGEAVAGGICNPATGLRVTGAIGVGCRLNGERACQVRDGETLENIRVLASRSEVDRGEWGRFEGAEFSVEATGSVAYKFALVAAGMAEATWTLVPKNEWDVAGGVALVKAAGGDVVLKDGRPPRFNREDVLMPGLIAAGRRRLRKIQQRLEIET